MATAPAPTERAHRAAKRYIYAWGGGAAEGDATMRDLLGGKGAGLAEMTNAGLPVPPGFCVTTDGYRAFVQANQLQAEIMRLVAAVQPEEMASLDEIFLA